MSKYYPLREYLEARRDDEWHASFKEIEKILGFKLPSSARNYPAWWSNETSGSHSHAQAWAKAGWQAEYLNLTANRISFRRKRKSHASPISQNSMQTAIKMPRLKKSPEKSIKSALKRNLVVVIQCASKKSPNAGHYLDQAGRKVAFVARPDIAPKQNRTVYARPDDLSDDQTLTWRERLLAYNNSSQGKKLGLLPAGQLYARREYYDLVNAFGAENIFILSAGWGLIRADFLTPYYDITFSNSADHYKKRRRKDVYDDFCQIPDDYSNPILFFGGKDYQLLFEHLTEGIDTKKIIFHSSASISQKRGFNYFYYKSAARTNWHYLCVQDLLNYRLPELEGLI